MAGGEQRIQLLCPHLGAEPEGGAAVSPPAAGWLRRVEVVVDRPPPGAVPAGLIVGQAGVVGQKTSDVGGGRLEGGGPHHGRRPAGRNALVCASWF